MTPEQIQQILDLISNFSWAKAIAIGVPIVIAIIERRRLKAVAVKVYSALSGKATVTSNLQYIDQLAGIRQAVADCPNRVTDCEKLAEHLANRHVCPLAPPVTPPKPAVEA